jgi:apolipoprotein D and lipocalin family protein
MNKIATLILSIAAFSSSAMAFAKIETVPSVNLGRFAGAWYEIARNPIIFEPKCACARQLLSPLPDAKISVLNTCNKDTADGKLTEISGTAEASDETNSKLAVDFGFPWKGQYWIIALAPDYSYAAVTDSWGYSLYILSKTPTLDAASYQAALDAAQAQVSIKRLVVTDQTGCTYPAVTQ